MPATKPRRTKAEREIAKQLACNPRAPGRCYKLSETGVARDTIILADDIDPGEMRVGPIVINTPAVDRDLEIIEPGGVDTTNYQTNPVVMWDHGFGSIGTPIARSEDNQGNFALTKSEEAIAASAYFSSRDVCSYQIFTLIDEKIVRAASIHVLPAPGTAEYKTLADGTRIILFPQSEMIEWSFGCVGVNPEAVRKICSDKKVGSEGIAEPLLKSLLPFAAPKPSSDANRRRTKAMPPEDEKKPEDEVKAEETKPEETQEETAPEEESMKGKPSERFLSAIGEGIASLAAMVEAGESEIENPEALTYAGELKNRLGEMAGECEATLSALSGGKAKKAKKSLPVDDGDAIRDYIRLGGAKPTLVKGYAEQIAAVARAKNLDDGQRATLESVAAQLRRIKSLHKPKTEPKPEVTAAIEDVKKSRAATREQLESLKGRLAAFN